MRDVRITPVILARALAEQAIGANWSFLRGKPSIEVLDPACGSGVFLQEALRELISRGYSGALKLRGFDRSSISCAVARFCLGRAKTEADGISVDVGIEEKDALRDDWGHPDLILMNPPFVPWERLTGDEDRQAVKTVLGELGTGRVDMAMAFIWKGAGSLENASVLASVMPAPLFETESGLTWREALATKYDVLLLGRFEGYSFFRESMVEPGILVLRRTAAHESALHRSTRVLFAKTGREEVALRGLRQDSGPTDEDQGWEMFEVGQSVLSSASWMPRPRRSMQLVESLAEAGVTTVGDLFRVHQGIRTGLNKAFILSSEELNGLPKRERKYFRPVAGNSTIRNGTLSPSRYVFYPYGTSGILLKTDREVKSEVPKYYEGWLAPNVEALKQRRGINPDSWWLLTRGRHWQWTRKPKIVTSYFGYRGAFAYDDTGEYAVVQGYFWLWKRTGTKHRPEPAHVGGKRDRSFYRPLLPWAYLAIVNSRVFEGLLEAFCPRVQGGQFNLSTRFVNGMLLPDLLDDLRVTAMLLEELAEAGRRIHRGDLGDTKLMGTIDELAARAYGAPTGSWIHPPSGR